MNRLDELLGATDVAIPARDLKPGDAVRTSTCSGAELAIVHHVEHDRGVVRVKFAMGPCSYSPCHTVYVRRIP